MIDPALTNGPHDHDHLGQDAPQLRTSVGDLIQRLARIVLGADLRGLDETERRAMLDASATIESLAAENAALRDELERVKADCHNWQQQAGYAETWNQEQGAMIRELTAERDEWKRTAELCLYTLVKIDAAFGEPEEGGGLDPQRPHGDTGT